MRKSQRLFYVVLVLLAQPGEKSAKDVIYYQLYHDRIHTQPGILQ